MVDSVLEDSRSAARNNLVQAELDTVSYTHLRAHET